MNILITGGAGFIGSHLAERLLYKGDKVGIIDNFATGRKENVPEGAILSTGSIANMNEVSSIFDAIKPDVVIHAAASYKDPTDWYNDSLTNVHGTANILHACKIYNCRRIIYFQTSLCYGHPQEQPITLKHPINPTNSYSISKTAAEQYIKLSGLDFVSFRLANCYGKRNLSGPIPTFYNRLSKGQKCFVVNTRRDFVFVEDLCDIVMKAIYGTGYGYYHISTGKDYSIKEIYDLISKEMGLEDVKAEERERGKDDVETILLDPSRTTREFKLVPSTPLAKGIKKAIEWYKSNAIKKTYTHLEMDK